MNRLFEIMHQYHDQYPPALGGYHGRILFLTWFGKNQEIRWHKITKTTCFSLITWSWSQNTVWIIPKRFKRCQDILLTILLLGEELICTNICAWVVLYDYQTPFNSVLALKRSISEGWRIWLNGGVWCKWWDILHSALHDHK